MKPFLSSSNLRMRSIAIAFASTLAIAGCSSSDDTPAPETPETPDPAADDVNLVLPLSSDITVPPANVDGATGEVDITVNTVTGAVSGTATVSGTTGVPTAAHIHAGAAGEAGPILVALEAEDATGAVWNVVENAALDAAGIALFQEGNTYLNVHTEANAPGELRAQLAAPAAPEPAAAGSFTITMTNTSTSQPMTPPILALHNPPTGDNGIRLFEVGQPAIGEVVQIAEDGNNTPLVDVLTGQTGNTVSAFAVGFADPANPGPLTPGASATVTLDGGEATGQVLSVVAMVVCTNDGFTGFDSMELPTAETTLTAPIYDAGSETNVLTLNYWVPPCGGTGNIGDDEGGAITAHPGQSGSENPDFDFPAGSQFLELTITPN